MLLKNKIKYICFLKVEWWWLDTGIHMLSLEALFWVHHSPLFTSTFLFLCNDLIIWWLLSHCSHWWPFLYWCFHKYAKRTQNARVIVNIWITHHIPRAEIFSMAKLGPIPTFMTGLYNSQVFQNHIEWPSTREGKITWNEGRAVCQIKLWVDKLFDIIPPLKNIFRKGY